MTQQQSGSTIYNSKLTIYETEQSIQLIKENFNLLLSNNLNLQRVSAPLYVKKNTGLNDRLNYVESPVTFRVKSGEECEIVHSLAKWKRYALGKYKFEEYAGLYTDMNALRICEDLSPLHSYYVDQWDWEIVINKKDRNLEFLKKTVNKIYESLKKLEKIINKKYQKFSQKLPENIFFITTQELEDLHPTLSPKEREHAFGKEKKAFFLIGVGGKLKSGNAHDGRAPDYDDWSLNGDIIVYSDVLGISVELSSMGIRVCEDTLIKQLEIANKIDNLKLEFHQKLINKELPYTIGGGIGQSRLCMFLTEKKHIGEVQVSVWPEELIKEAEDQNIFFL